MTRNLPPKHAPNPPQRLLRHQIPPLPRPLHRILILLRASREVLHALPRRPPNEVLIRLRDNRLGLPPNDNLSLDLNSALHELAAHLVRHALELAVDELHPRLTVGCLRFLDFHGAAHRLGVVRGEREADVGVGGSVFAGGGAQDGVVGAAEDRLGEGVVHDVCVFLGVVDQVARVGVDVSPPDELDASDEPFFARGGKVGSEDLGAGFEVGLVGGVDDGALFVVAAHQLEDPGVDAGLEGGLLGVEDETDAAGCGEVADGGDGVFEGGAHREVVREVVECLASGAGELDGDESAGVDEGDGLESPFLPGDDFIVDGGLGGGAAGCFEGSGGVGIEDDFTGVAEHDALVAHGLERVDGARDLGGGLAGTEVSVEGALEDGAEDGVAVGV